MRSFIGVQAPDGPVIWVVGQDGYTDAFGPVAPISTTETGWQQRQTTIPVPAW